MQVFVDKLFFKNERYLRITKESVSWSDEVQDNSLFLSLTEKNNFSKLLESFEIDLPDFFDKPLEKICKTLGVKDPALHRFLSENAYREKFLKLESLIKTLRKIVFTENYFQKYCEGQEVLEKLEPSWIDKKKLVQYAREEKNPTVKSTLKSFIPEKSGFCLPPSYDRTKTVTGRLVVSEGPQVLLLPKKYRDVISSNYEDGLVVSIDFVSLEPRFTKLLFCEETKEDIYSDIASSIDLNLSRKEVKLAVLSILFGAGISKLTEHFDREAMEVKKQVSNYFNLEEVSKIVDSNFRDNSLVNYFGRPIKVRKSARNVLLNNYIQSSCVDVALMGFSKLLKEFSNIESLRPLAVIHDALVVDLKKSKLQELEKIVSNGIKIENLGKFFLEVESYEK